MNTIAAMATSTGLTVTAVLDAGRTGRGRGERRADAAPRRTLHRPARPHGDWNYTILPDPRPAPDPDPAPRPPRPRRAWTLPSWTSPRDRAAAGGAAALAAALAIPHAAHRAARLHANRRGRPRKRADKPRNDPRHKMTFPGYVLAAILHQRFALPARAIAALAATAPPSATNCPAPPSSWPPPPPPSRPAPSPWPPQPRLRRRQRHPPHWPRKNMPPERKIKEMNIKELSGAGAPSPRTRVSTGAPTTSAATPFTAVWVTGGGRSPR